MALTLALIGAGGAAVLWALITLWTGYEIGWIAWIVGGMVGGSCAFAGGRGKTAAVVCGALALVTILGGKLIAANIAIHQAVEEMAIAEFDADSHRSWHELSTTWVNLPDDAPDEDVESLMLEHDFDMTVPEFREHVGPFLEEWAAAPPTLEQWRQSFVDETLAEVSMLDAVRENLEVIDLIFAILGITTAYGLVMKASSSSRA